MPMPSMKEVVANRPSMVDFLFRLSCISLFPFPFSAASPLSSAALSLHAFRGSLPEPSRSILLWNESSSPCRWPGVGCSADPSSSVDSLNLSSLGLHSGLTDASVAHLCSIDTLVSVNLSDNRFAGAIPPSFQSCTRLHTLLLSRNLFTGRLPPGLFRSPHLVGLDVGDNSLYGDIPAEIAGREKLEYLTSKTSPENTDPSYAKWYAENQKVKGWLLTSMTPEIMKCYLRLPTAREIWSALAKVFYDGADESQLFTLNQRAFSTKQKMLFPSG